jgi:hypothetical protein
VSSAQPFDGNQFLHRIADSIQQQLANRGIEIAHFKMTLSPDTGNDLAVLNLVRTDGRAETPHQLAEHLNDGELIVNLRAEDDPEQLRAVAVPAFDRVAREMKVGVEVEHIEHFRPGRPEPTHRMAMP